MHSRCIHKAITAMEAAEKLCLELQDLIDLRNFLQKMEAEAKTRRAKPAKRNGVS